MAGVFGWISDLLQWFGAWIPRLLIVRTTQGGVKFVRGKCVKVIVPGLAVYWPLVTAVEITHVARQAIDLPNQTLTTRDGRSVIVSGVVVYSIRDVKKFLVDNYDSHAAIAEVALSAVRHVVISSDFESLCRGGRVLDARLRAEARKSLKSFGVDVEYVRLSDLSACRVVSLVGSPQPMLQQAQ